MKNSKKTSKSKRGRGEKYQILSPAKIKVVGVGGAGGNIVTRMSVAPFRGVEFIAINTDTQDLEASTARKKIHIGKNLTRGLGAGMNPELGKQAAEENLEEITAALEGADMIFVTGGMGGGTGTFGSSVVADAARKTGALVIGVVTKPFFFEGSQRMKIAEEGITRLKDRVDALITIPNDRIFNVIDPETPIVKAFERIDDVLRGAVLGISELITFPGIINVDFADVRAVMQEAGTAIVGTASASGKDRAVSAAQQAVFSPLIETGIEGARGILFGISGGRDMKMSEVNEAARFITESADPSCKVIFGAYHDKRLKPGVLKITVLAAGFNGYRSVDDQNLGLFDDEHRVEISGGPMFETQTPSVQKKEDVKKFQKQDVSAASSDAVSSSAKKYQTHNVQKKNDEQENSDDMWDIPAFLRRKKK